MVYSLGWVDAIIKDCKWIGVLISFVGKGSIAHLTIHGQEVVGIGCSAPALTDVDLMGFEAPGLDYCCAKSGSEQALKSVFQQQQLAVPCLQK